MESGGDMRDPHPRPTPTSVHTSHTHFTNCIGAGEEDYVGRSKEGKIGTEKDRKFPSLPVSILNRQSRFSDNPLRQCANLYSIPHPFPCPLHQSNCMCNCLRPEPLPLPLHGSLSPFPDPLPSMGSAQSAKANLPWYDSTDWT